MDSHSQDVNISFTPPVNRDAPDLSPQHDPRNSLRAFRPPLMSPRASRTVSQVASVSGRDNLSHSWFRSRRVKKGEIEKPWMEQKYPKQKWINIIPLLGIGIGLSLSTVYVYFGVHTIVNHNYCPVLIDEFSELNSIIWMKEVQVGGFG